MEHRTGMYVQNAYNEHVSAVDFEHRFQQVGRVGRLADSNELSRLADSDPLAGATRRETFFEEAGVHGGRADFHGLEAAWRVEIEQAPRHEAPVPGAHVPVTFVPEYGAYWEIFIRELAAPELQKRLQDAARRPISRPPRESLAHRGVREAQKLPGHPELRAARHGLRAAR